MSCVTCFFFLWGSYRSFYNEEHNVFLVPEWTLLFSVMLLCCGRPQFMCCLHLLPPTPDEQFYWVIHTEPPVMCEPGETPEVENTRLDTTSVRKSWSQRLFPFSDKTQHRNKLETKLKKERSFLFISFPFVSAASQVHVQFLIFLNSNDANNEIGEKSLFPRTQKDFL